MTAMTSAPIPSKDGASAGVAQIDDLTREPGGVGEEVLRDDHSNGAPVAFQLGLVLPALHGVVRPQERPALGVEVAGAQLLAVLQSEEVVVVGAGLDPGHGVHGGTAHQVIADVGHDPSVDLIAGTLLCRQEAQAHVPSFEPVVDVERQAHQSLLLQLRRQRQEALLEQHLGVAAVEHVVGHPAPLGGGGENIRVGGHETAPSVTGFVRSNPRTTSWIRWSSSRLMTVSLRSGSASATLSQPS